MAAKNTTKKTKANKVPAPKPKPKQKWVICMNPKCRYEWISRLKGNRLPKECPMCKMYGVTLIGWR